MRRISLNDDWSVRPKVHRFAELMGESTEWTRVTLPHDAMIGGERTPSAGPQSGYFPGGSWEYRRTLEVPIGDTDAVVLEFEGVYRDAVVSVNGTLAAHRPYGYSNFFVPVDHLLRHDAENELRVEVRAGEDSRWYSGAGIYRNVWLLQSGRVHLAPDGLQVRTPEIDDAGAAVVVAVDVRNESGATSRSTTPRRAARRRRRGRRSRRRAGDHLPGRHHHCRGSGCTLPTRDVGAPTIRTSTPAAPPCSTTTSWSTRSRRRSASDRSRSIPNAGCGSTASRCSLRGACVHHDNGVLGAATIDRADERRVELLQAAGFNAIRSAHNPMSRAMLDACDRLGMLVMDETFDMWMQTKSEDDYALRFADWWEADVEAMVRKDVNHPSVILYSIGNEVPDGSTPAGLHLGRALAEKVRALDPTRFVTQAVDRPARRRARIVRRHPRRRDR